MIYTFYKTEDSRWYIDLPTWKGSIADLEMVAGADVMLDILSGNKNILTIDLSDSYKDKEKWDKPVILELHEKHTGLTGGGATYMWGDEKIWLCDVTKFVFDGHFPHFIVFGIINE
jgi:hypothetical protein